MQVQGAAWMASCLGGQDCRLKTAWMASCLDEVKTSGSQAHWVKAAGPCSTGYCTSSKPELWPAGDELPRTMSARQQTFKPNESKTTDFQAQ